MRCEKQNETEDHSVDCVWCQRQFSTDFRLIDWAFCTSKKFRREGTKMVKCEGKDRKEGGTGDKEIWELTQGPISQEANIPIG